MKNSRILSRLSIIGLIICFGLVFAGYNNCGSGNPNKNSADVVQARASQVLLSEAQRQVGMPNIVNFQQRKLMKLIYELCDKEDLVCYAYIKSDYQGKLFFIGKCIGFGIPFSAQFTNPMRIYDAEGRRNYWKISR